MWDSIPLRLRNEWKAFYDLEPDEGERTDWGLAHIVQVLVGGGKPLRDFMLPFGDTPGPVVVPQPVAYQEMLIDAWIQGSNAILKKKGT